MWIFPYPLPCHTAIRTVFLFFSFLIFIVIQLQSYAFSPPPSTPPQLHPPPSPTSTMPPNFVHVSFIIVPAIPSSHCPHPIPPGHCYLKSESNCNIFVLQMFLTMANKALPVPWDPPSSFQYLPSQERTQSCNHLLHYVWCFPFAHPSIHQLVSSASSTSKIDSYYVYLPPPSLHHSCPRHCHFLLRPAA